jgi:uncharacterized oxidoreductase
MKTHSAPELQRIGVQLFMACGAPPDEAAAVTDELVESSLMGLDSHGVIRFPEYVDLVLSGAVKTGTPTRVLRESGATALVDCGLNFGQVTARRMTAMAGAKAKASGIACVLSINSGHVGRLGSYPQKLAEDGLFGMAFVNATQRGQMVWPFGGATGRLATNPIAFGAPSDGDPVLLDMSTSALPEGKIRLLLQQGKQAPPGVIVDNQGNPITDPALFYTEPRGGLLPLGGPFGHKGFGLGVMVEIAGGLLAGVASSVDHPQHNGLCLIAIDPDAFCGRERFRELVSDLVAYMNATPPAPGSSGVIMPGAPEFVTKRRRMVEGIPVADETWRLMVEAGRRVNVMLEA